MKRCAQCDGKKNHPIHLAAVGMPGHHPYQDASPSGLQPVSAARRAYLASDEHRDAYGVAEAYCVGHALDAPGKCFGPLTAHHTMKRSAAGLEASERLAPVVTLCAWLNGAIESDPEVRAWAIRSTFNRGGQDFPFLVTKGKAA